MKKRFTIDQIIKILAEADTPGNFVVATAKKMESQNKPSTGGGRNIEVSLPPKLSASKPLKLKRLASNGYWPKKNSKSRP